MMKVPNYEHSIVKKTLVFVLKCIYEHFDITSILYHFFLKVNEGFVPI